MTGIPAEQKHRHQQKQAKTKGTHLGKAPPSLPPHRFPDPSPPLSNARAVSLAGAAPGALLHQAKVASQALLDWLQAALLRIRLRMATGKLVSFMPRGGEGERRPTHEPPSWRTNFDATMDDCGNRQWKCVNSLVEVCRHAFTDRQTDSTAN